MPIRCHYERLRDADMLRRRRQHATGYTKAADEMAADIDITLMTICHTPLMLHRLLKTLAGALDMMLSDASRYAIERYA